MQRGRTENRRPAGLNALKRRSPLRHVTSSKRSSFGAKEKIIQHIIKQILHIYMYTHIYKEFSDEFLLKDNFFLIVLIFFTPFTEADFLKCAQNTSGLGWHRHNRRPRVSGKYRAVPSAQALSDQACIRLDSAKNRHDTCCWPWVFRKSSLFPLLVLSVLFCCKCLSLEAADELRALLELFPPCEKRGGKKRMRYTRGTHIFKNLFFLFRGFSSQLRDASSPRRV